MRSPFDGRFTDSHDTLAAIAGYGPRGRLEQVLWGADTARFRPVAAGDKGERFRIVSLRAWEPLYRIDVVIDAVAALLEALPHIRAQVELHLLGGGSQEEALRARVRATLARAFDLSRPLAEIALLERDVLRTTRRLPERLTPVDIEQTRIAPRILLQHLAITLDRLFGVGILRDRNTDDR